MRAAGPWVPKSFGLSLISYEADVRVGGAYRLVFVHGASEPMAFHGKYLEVTPCSRLAWTNEEGGDAGQVTTVTFEEKAGKTLVVLHELYPSKEALDAARASGAEEGTLETFWTSSSPRGRGLNARCQRQGRRAQPPTVGADCSGLARLDDLRRSARAPSSARHSQLPSVGPRAAPIRHAQPLLLLI